MINSLYFIDTNIIVDRITDYVDAHVARGATGGDTFRKYLKMELAANDSSSEYRYFLFKCDEVD